jgi:hypothetical protein
VWARVQVFKFSSIAWSRYGKALCFACEAGRRGAPPIHRPWEARRFTQSLPIATNCPILSIDKTHCWHWAYGRSAAAAVKAGKTAKLGKPTSPIPLISGRVVRDVFARERGPGGWQAPCV